MRARIAFPILLGALAGVACSSSGPSGDGSGTDAAVDGTSADAPAEATPEASPDAVPDAGPDTTSGSTCAPGSSLYFRDPGCNLAPACLGDGQDACLGVYCDCNGVTFTDGCDYAKRPFAQRGSCAGSNGAE